MHLYLLRTFQLGNEECHDLKDLDVTNKTTKRLSLIHWCYIWKCKTYKSTSDAFKSDKHDDNVLNNMVLQWQMSKTHSSTKSISGKLMIACDKNKGLRNKGPFGTHHLHENTNKMARERKQLIETWENICMIIYLLLLTLATILKICKNNR